MFEGIFTADPVYNQSLWLRSPYNPVVTTARGTWCADFLSDSTILKLDGDLAMYVEGSAAGIEQIGLFTCPVGEIEAGKWAADYANPIVHAGPGSFDRGSVFDPSVVAFDGRYLMYYSATRTDAHALAEQLEHDDPDPSQIDDSGETLGLAVSEDGRTFTKWADNPVMPGRCPHAIEHEGRLYLYFVRIVQGGYRIFLATSNDGYSFRATDAAPVLSIGEQGSWDALTVTTPKIFREDGRFFMLYAGGAISLDDPTGIGMAVSEDLIHWSKCPGNPIFTTGPVGSFDSISVASPIVHKQRGEYYLFYAGSDRSIRTGLHSQVGLATLVAPPRARL